jgi:hypothetical protein
MEETSTKDNPIEGYRELLMALVRNGIKNDGIAIGRINVKYANDGTPMGVLIDYETRKRAQV